MSKKFVSIFVYNSHFTDCSSSPALANRQQHVWRHATLNHDKIPLTPAPMPGSNNSLWHPECSSEYVVWCSISFVTFSSHCRPVEFAIATSWYWTNSKRCDTQIQIETRKNTPTDGTTQSLAQFCWLDNFTLCTSTSSRSRKKTHQEKFISWLKWFILVCLQKRRRAIENLNNNFEVIFF